MKNLPSCLALNQGLHFSERYAKNRWERGLKNWAWQSFIHLLGSRSFSSPVLNSFCIILWRPHKGCNFLSSLDSQNPITTALSRMPSIRGAIINPFAKAINIQEHNESKICIWSDDLDIQNEIITFFHLVFRQKVNKEAKGFSSP